MTDIFTPLISALLVLIAVAVVVAWTQVRKRKARRPPLPPPPEGQPPVEQQAPPPALPDKAAPAAETPTAWKDGLARTRGGFVARLAGLLGKKEIDPALLDQLEEVLLTADIGVKTAHKLFAAVRAQLDRNHLRDADAVWGAIRSESEKLLASDAPPFDPGRAKPFVILTIGVNGGGKTTTIGKLAARLVGQGRSVLLAAGDTFRAAATEQLEIWAQRSGAGIVKGKEGSDPSSVIFDAIRRARADHVDVVIADTAGRLQTKTNLMEELKKIRRVIQKADPTAPHETLLVLDSTNGQNAIAQAQVFKEAMEITGIVLTKLDGTAKGGVILGICDDLHIPVRFVGVGERAIDLREFDPAGFVDALYPRGEVST